MNTIKKLKDYLIEKEEYLLKNHAKVLMISGTWGSGKTYFWHESDESIEKMLNNKEKPNIYISLYGKTSLKSIENEVFIKAYYKSLNREDDEKDIIEKLSSTFSSLTGVIDDFSGTNITKPIEYIKSLNQSHKDDKVKKFIEDGLIICFDDFERKSTNVDLNDLFGFITNLALQYKAMVVIILNDDIFEGKDKKVFATIKEKSVNKFLKYQPLYEELFDVIFSNFELDEANKSVILHAFKDLKILNARIYHDTLENLQEYLSKYPDVNNEEIRYFVLTKIHFNLNHIVFKFDNDIQDEWILPTIFDNLSDIPIDLINSLNSKIIHDKNQAYIQSEVIDYLKLMITSKYKYKQKPDKETEIKPTEKLAEDLKKVDKYVNIIWSFWELEVKLEYRKDVEKEKINIINDFIETGILT